MVSRLVGGADDVVSEYSACGLGYSDVADAS